MEKLSALMTVLLGILEIKPVLKQNLKTPWPWFMLRSMNRANRLFKKTRWGRRKDAEAQYAKSVIILAGIYLELGRRLPTEKAHAVMNQVVLRISHALDYATARKHLLFTIKDPFERWLKYRSILITESFGLHNDVEDVYIHRSRMHYIVKRCIFHDVFAEAGTPELTAMICDYDEIYHSSIFPEFFFDRNGNPHNTIGHGCEFCHYVWKDKQVLSREFKEYLESRAEEAAAGEERRRGVRRQADRRQSERRHFDRRQQERRQA